MSVDQFQKDKRRTTQKKEIIKEMLSEAVFNLFIYLRREEGRKALRKRERGRERERILPVC